jgi:copper chaperone CopZ
MEWMMKKTFFTFIILTILASFLSVAVAAERIVQLTVPGCVACGASHRIGAILKETKGVIKYQFGNKDLLTVTFDDKITALDTIISKLEKGGNKINGKPVYVK